MAIYKVFEVLRKVEEMYVEANNEQLAAAIAAQHTQSA